MSCCEIDVPRYCRRTGDTETEINVPRYIDCVRSSIHDHRNDVCVVFKSKRGGDRRRSMIAGEEANESSVSESQRDLGLIFSIAVLCDCNSRGPDVGRHCCASINQTNYDFSLQQNNFFKCTLRTYY